MLRKAPRLSLAAGEASHLLSAQPIGESMPLDDSAVLSAAHAFAWAWVGVIVAKWQIDPTFQVGD